VCALSGHWMMVRSSPSGFFFTCLPSFFYTFFRVLLFF
jgi:hypothetical protein